jgi:hypothetical protein
MDNVILISTVVQDFVNMENASKLVKTIMIALTKNIVKMISACPTYVKSIVIVGLKINVLKKHVDLNVRKSLIVHLERSVFMIFVQFHQGDNARKIQVDSNFI